MLMNLRTTGVVAVLLAATVAPWPAYSQAPLVRGAIISGRLVDAFECPIVDAIVKLRPGATSWGQDYLQETRSDSEGAFTFSPVAAERYYWIRYDFPAGGWGGDSVMLTSAGNHVILRWPRPAP